MILVSQPLSILDLVEAGGDERSDLGHHGHPQRRGQQVTDQDVRSKVRRLSGPANKKQTSMTIRQV